jgi:hypothetical protein
MIEGIWLTKKRGTQHLKSTRKKFPGRTVVKTVIKGKDLIMYPTKNTAQYIKDETNAAKRRADRSTAK